MSNGKKPVLYSCRACGSKFSPQSTGGICPYCHSANPALVELQRKNFKRQQIRKKQLRKAAFRLSVALLILIILIISAVSIISHIIRGSETLVYATENIGTSPVFYTDSDGLVYYCENNNPFLLGKGSIIDFSYSEKNKVAYAVFNGTTNLDSLTSSVMLLKITDSGKKIDTVAESAYGTINFKSGGNCEYIYYIINESLSNYQSSARLYLYQTSGGDPKKIAEYSNSGFYDNFRVSLNGRYLLYKAEDGDGTKLMRYSVKSGENEALGIKNAEPITIDNKGIYYSYIRKNEDGLADFYIESGVSDREKTALDKAFADRILVSNDARSFVIETGNITTVKTVGTEPCVIAAKTGSGIGIQILKALSETDSSELISSSVYAIEYCENSGFLPYYYMTENDDGTQTLMSCSKNGEKNSLTESTFSDFCTNGSEAAFISDNSLYTMQIDAKNTATTLVSENFESYKLSSMSDDGKYIFFTDSDGNLYRIPFKYNGANWTKVAVDAVSYVSSDDGHSGAYISGASLYFIRDSKQEKISDGVNTNKIYVMNDAGLLYYLASSDTSKADNAYSLYFFDGKNNALIQDNIVDISAFPYFSLLFEDIPFSTYADSPSDLPEEKNQNDGENNNTDSENSQI